MIGKVSCRLCEAAEHCCCSRGRNPSLVKTIVEEYQAEADLLEAVLHYGLESVNLISLHDSPRQFVRRDACPECLPEQIYTACSAFLVKHIAVPSEVFVQESSFLKLSSPVVFAQTTQRRRKDLAFPGEACDDAGCAIVRSHLFERFLKCESIKVLWPFLNERHILLAAKVLTNFFEESTFACAATTYNEVVVGAVNERLIACCRNECVLEHLGVCFAPCITEQVSTAGSDARSFNLLNLFGIRCHCSLNQQPACAFCRLLLVSRSRKGWCSEQSRFLPRRPQTGRHVVRRWDSPWPLLHDPPGQVPLDSLVCRPDGTQSTRGRGAAAGSS